MDRAKNFRPIIVLAFGVVRLLYQGMLMIIVTRYADPRGRPVYVRVPAAIFARKQHDDHGEPGLTALTRELPLSRDLHSPRPLLRHRRGLHADPLCPVHEEPEPFPRLRRQQSLRQQP